MWRAAVNQHSAVAIRKQRLMHELAELKDKALRGEIRALSGRAPEL